jgi:hypothetical protein
VDTGTTGITASEAAITSPSQTLTVNPAVLESIAVTPVDPTITLGDTQQFTATGTYSDSSTADITATVIWTSSNTSVATIAATGLATSVDTGTTGITASEAAITSPSQTLTVSVDDHVTIEEIDQYIQDLSPGAFKKHSARTAQRWLHNKLVNIAIVVDAGEYERAIANLQTNIRVKADGYVDGSLKNDWIIDPEAQQEICMMIDNLIAYLETLL